MPEQEKNPTQTLGGAYPDKEVPKVDTSKLEARIKELEDQNKALLDKVKNAETDNIRHLAEQVADTKISKKMLTKEKRDDEVAKLSKLSVETLNTLSNELSQIVVNLSAEDIPKPLAPPTEAPVQLTESQKLEQDTKEMRLKLFGHTEPADEYYKKQKEEELKHRTW